MISTFIKQLFLNPVIKKIITDVDPNNHRPKVASILQCNIFLKSS